MARKSKKQRNYEKTQKIKARKQKRYNSITSPHRKSIQTFEQSYNLAGLVAMENFEHELRGMPQKLANIFRNKLFEIRLEILHKIGKDNYNNKIVDALIGEKLLAMKDTEYNHLQRHPKDSDTAVDEWGHDLLNLLTNDIEELKNLSEQLGDEYA